MMPRVNSVYQENEEGREGVLSDSNLPFSIQIEKGEKRERAICAASDLENLTAGGKRKTGIPGHVTAHANEQIPRIRDGIVCHVLLRRGYVDGSCLLTLPVSFCQAHLPDCDERVLLVGEDNIEYAMEFIAQKRAFGGHGWKHFADVKQLKKGDSLSIQKIMPLKFQVFIKRSSSSSLNLIGSSSQHAPKDMGGRSSQTLGRTSSALELARCEDSSPQTPSTTIDVPSHNVVSTSTHFDHNNFTADLISDSEVFPKLQERTLRKYQEICRTQKMYLHSNLLGNYNPLFVAGSIEELTDTCEAIRFSTLSTPHDHYEKWGNKLAVLESVGMEVGFLRRGLERLTHLARSNPNREKEWKRLLEARAAKDDLESKINEMKKTLNNLDDEIANLARKHEKESSNYLDEAAARWI